VLVPNLPLRSQCYSNSTTSWSGIFIAGPTMYIICCRIYATCSYSEPPILDLTCHPRGSRYMIVKKDASFFPTTWLLQTRACYLPCSNKVKHELEEVVHGILDTSLSVFSSTASDDFLRAGAQTSHFAKAARSFFPGKLFSLTSTLGIHDSRNRGTEFERIRGDSLLCWWWGLWRASACDA